MHRLRARHLNQVLHITHTVNVLHRFDSSVPILLRGSHTFKLYIASTLGKLPTLAEYHAAMGIVNKDADSVYRYLNFDQIEEYADTAKGVTV